MEIKKNKITVVLGINTDLNIEEENLEKEFLKGQKLSEYIKNRYPNLAEEKINEALKICLLSEVDINKCMNILSSSEIEKIELLIKLLDNKEVIILSDFDSSFGQKELKYFKDLFKKMVTKYNKTIVFITNKLDNIMDIIDIILVVDNKKVVLELNSKDIYYDSIYDYVDMPPIVEFVKYLKKNKITMPDYIDLKELIKGIFRSVK